MSSDVTVCCCCDYTHHDVLSVAVVVTSVTICYAPNFLFNMMCLLLFNYRSGSATPACFTSNYQVDAIQKKIL